MPFGEGLRSSRQFLRVALGADLCFGNSALFFLGGAITFKISLSHNSQFVFFVFFVASAFLA